MNPTPRITDDEVAALPISGVRADLLEAIVTTPVDIPDRVKTKTPDRRRPRWLVPIGVAAAIAVIAAVPIGVTLTDDGDKGPEAGAPSLEANRAVFETPSGWVVANIENGAVEGEMGYNGPQSADVDIKWFPAEYFDEALAEAREDIGRPTAIRALDADAQRYSYSPQDHKIFVPPVGGTFLELRLSGFTEDALPGVLDQIRRVNADQLVDGLPAYIVTPEEAPAVFTEMTADVPLPAGFDPAGVEPDGYQDRYDAGGTVINAVACAWITQYGEGRSSGDQAAVDEATEAMQSSREWPILIEMQQQGGWPGIFYPMGGQMARGVPAERIADPIDGCLGGDGQR